MTSDLLRSSVVIGVLMSAVFTVGCGSNGGSESRAGSGSGRGAGSEPVALPTSFDGNPVETCTEDYTEVDLESSDEALTKETEDLQLPCREFGDGLQFWGFTFIGMTRFTSETATMAREIREIVPSVGSITYFTSGDCADVNLEDRDKGSCVMGVDFREGVPDGLTKYLDDAGSLPQVTIGSHTIYDAETVAVMVDDDQAIVAWSSDPVGSIRSMIEAS